jgi:hypothetical protein
MLRDFLSEERTEIAVVPQKELLQNTLALMGAPHPVVRTAVPGSLLQIEISVVVHRVLWIGFPPASCSYQSIKLPPASSILDFGGIPANFRPRSVPIPPTVPDPSRFRCGLRSIVPCAATGIAIRPGRPLPGQGSELLDRRARAHRKREPPHDSTVLLTGTRDRQQWVFDFLLAEVGVELVGTEHLGVLLD